MAGVREICRRSMLGLMKPLIRFALRHSFRMRDIVECLKKAFVDLAAEELVKLGESVSASKISAMTGLQRPEVNRLLSQDSESKRDVDVITRVVGLWESATRYKDRSGRAKILSFKGREGDFAELVSSVSTDLNPYTVAFELERVGVVAQAKNGLKLLKPGYESADNIEEGLSLLSQDAEDLHKAVTENIFESPKNMNLHVKTEFDNIPVSKVKEVRQWFQIKGAELHKEARAYLSSLDRDVNPKLKKDLPDEASIRAVIGTYSLTEEKK